MKTVCQLVFFPASSDSFITTVLLVFLPTKQFKQLPPERLRHTMLATFPAILFGGQTVSPNVDYGRPKLSFRGYPYLHVIGA